LSSLLVPAALHQNVEHIALLIDSPPQVVPFALDREKDLIQVPFVARSRALATELIGVRLPKLLAPLTDGFIGEYAILVKGQIGAQTS
jgi:hypothetical protein